MNYSNRKLTSGCLGPVGGRELLGGLIAKGHEDIFGGDGDGVMIVVMVLISAFMCQNQSNYTF